MTYESPVVHERYALRMTRAYAGSQEVAVSSQSPDYAVG